ncbi:hypothetical protein LOK74_10015 [Brevibacillus humidisoli]|uniref:hypothetical protein n=1 Tax=Brevibacillus humidisoli TaxID=2895522 RepID=UPI001E2CE5C6|nr:hypothetical protein [Brevibacillus humidisoli]UFJ42798.1 hypothetical protein LOK74_10015 [Brevibacillus humidisoli]
MNRRKWRNPYLPIHKQNERSEADPVSPSLAGSLAVRPKKPALVPADLRTSVSRMRSNIKGISSTIRQVEETMDTIYGAMEMLDSLGKSGTRPSPPAQTAANRSTPQSDEEKHPLGESTSSSTGSQSGNGLGNLDVNQLLAILQSPLVQNLLSQQSGGPTKRKKEG